MTWQYMLAERGSVYGDTKISLRNMLLDLVREYVSRLKKILDFRSIIDKIREQRKSLEEDI